MNPMDLKRGIDLAVEAVVADLVKNSKKVTLERGDRPGRHHLLQTATPKSASSSPTHEEGRQRGRHHG